VQEAARTLRLREHTVILMSGAALQDEQIRVAHNIASATGARIMAPTFNARIARGRGRPLLEIVPYPVDDAVALLKDVKHLILVGTTEPVAFFAYPGKPGIMSPPDAKSHVLARADQDLPDALQRLADELDCPDAAIPEYRSNAALPSGALTVQTAGQTLAALLPDDAIIIDEAITSRGPFFAATKTAAAHDWVQVPGGAIGGGLPLATGAAIGAPGRRVIVLEGDGSAMYTIQGLWTQARENLDVTTIILSNRTYAILFLELKNVGAAAGHASRDLFAIDRPKLDWVKLANAQGVEAAVADSVERFADLLQHANGRRGPFVIELTL
jgi:acetolactate synthase-1/2/3 large subunit